MEDTMESTIDLQDLFNIIKKNLIFIIIVTIALTATVYLYTEYGMTKKYASETSLRVVAVQQGNLEYNQVASRNLVNTYSYIARQRPIVEQVINNLELDYTYNQLKGSIEISSVSDTDIILIKVILPDAKQARDVANELAKVFTAEIKNQVKIDTISTIAPATVNNAVVSPNLRLNVVIGFVLGMMVSVGFVLLKEFLDRTIKDEKDVKEYLDVPVLGSLPHLEKRYINKS